MNEGTRVRVRPDALSGGRPHLRQHAARRDIGIVGGPPKQSPSMARMDVIVRFAECAHDHRLIETELELV